MAEYISREDAYNVLTEYYHHSTEVQHEALREAIGKVPTAEVGRWIPVTERLPEENGRYLTVMHRTVDPQYRNELGDSDTEVRITRYYQGEWKVPLHSPKWINEAITDIVTHWMEMPEAPKGENDG